MGYYMRILLGGLLAPILWILIIASLAGCGHFDKIEESKQPHKQETLQQRYEANLKKLTGWPSRTDCDGTLWASVALTAGVQLDIREAKDKEGKWYRSPSKDCFDTGRSRSDFSNDMLVGLILSASISDLREYFNWLRLHNYVMGRGDKGATIVKPNVLNVLMRRIGLKHAKRLPYIANRKDYVQHIQALMIYIDGRTTGFITRHELELLKKYDKGKDYLFAAIIARYNGTYSRATSMLMAEGKPPSYVRGDEPERYRLAHWLLAAKILLGDK